MTPVVQAALGAQGVARARHTTLGAPPTSTPGRHPSSPSRPSPTSDPVPIDAHAKPSSPHRAWVGNAEGSGRGTGPGGGSRPALYVASDQMHAFARTSTSLETPGLRAPRPVVSCRVLSGYVRCYCDLRLPPAAPAPFLPPSRPPPPSQILACEQTRSLRTTLLAARMQADAARRLPWEEDGPSAAARHAHTTVSSTHRRVPGAARKRERTRGRGSARVRSTVRARMQSM